MVLATRTLKLRSTGREVDVPIRIFAPELSGASWACRYEIDWPERPTKMTAWGADSVQAIMLALQMIGTDIYTSNYHKAGELVLERPGGGYGFPVPHGLRDMLEGDDARFF